MENVLQEKIIDQLKYMYQKESDHETMMIFFIRAMIYFNNKNIDTKQYVDFLIRELNLPNENKFIFNNVVIAKRYFDSEYSLENIMDDLMFRYLDMLSTNLKGEEVTKKDIIREYFGKYKIIADQKFKYEKKTHPYYQYRYKHFMLTLLYKDFNLNILPPERIEGIEYPVNHNDFQLTIDEYYQRFNDLYNKQNEKLKEKEIEDYIFRKKEILDGLKIIKRQYKVKSGIIDLLCEDKKGNKVIVELKTSNRPKDLIWQLNSYAKDVEKIYKKPVRKIAITPKLDKSIIRELKAINAELYYYQKKENEIVLIKQF